MRKVLSSILSVLLLIGIFFSVPVTANAAEKNFTNSSEEQRLLSVETSKLLSGIKGNAELSDVEKALLIHDRLAITCQYGYPIDSGYSKSTAHTAFSAIVLKKAVCQGYALAYKYLLELVGIKSEYVSSEAQDHGWNIVYINNVPYHVDVTWDDATTGVSGAKFEEGKVYHKNFLRSTQGMIETGHVAKDGTIDYKSTPTNATYDNYFWQNSDTAFQLVNNEIYYFDNVNEKLMRLNKIDGSDASLLKSVSYGGSQIWTESYSRLASDGAYLYYSTADTVYKYNPKTNTEEVKYKLDLSSEYGNSNKFLYDLTGFAYRDCSFVYECCILDLTYSFIEADQKIIVDSNHTQSGWIIDKNANCGTNGSKHIECTVCKTVIKTETIPISGSHKVGDWVTTKKPTTTAEGVKERKCSVCGALLEKATIPKLETLNAPTVKISNTAKGIKLTWGKVENAESYRVYRRTYDTKTKKYSEWTTLSKAQKDTSFVDTKVKLGTTYSYMVKAINSGVLSKGTVTKNLKYNVTPTVTVANASKGISVSWSPIANATGYEVYSSTYNAKTKKWSSFTKRATAKENAKSWTDTKAKSGTKYKYTVKALNGKVASAYNKSGVQIVRLAQPTTKIVNASNGIKVSWGKVSGATSYEILRAEYNVKTKKWSTAKKVATAKSSATSWTDTKVKSGVQYRYTVKAVNGKVYSSYKTTSGLMFLTMPKTTVKAVKNGVTVTWTQSTGATSYEVYRAEYNKKTKKYTAFKKVATAKSTAKSYTDKTAKKGVKYKYTVKAVNGKVASAYKAVVVSR